MCCFKRCAVVAVVTSSSMLVVCFSEPLMRRTSSANLRLGRFTSRSVFGNSGSVVVTAPHFRESSHNVFGEVS